MSHRVIFFKCSFLRHRVVMLGLVEGDRPRGRPARRWSDGITDWCGCSLQESVQLASDREKWRGVVGLNGAPGPWVLKKKKVIKDLRRELKLKLPPPLKYVAALPCEMYSNWSIIHLYSTVNSAQSDAKTFNYSKYSRGCYFFICLHRLFYHMCLKCLPSSRTQALSGARHWSMDASIVRCSVLC